MTYSNECPKCGKPTGGKALCGDCDNSEQGKRHRMHKGGNDYYLFVSDRSIMFSGPGESGVKDQEFFQLINLVCRLTSKLRSNGVEWAVIRKQFESVDVTGGRTFVKEILGHIKN